MAVPLVALRSKSFPDRYEAHGSLRRLVSRRPVLPQDGLLLPHQLRAPLTRITAPASAGTEPHKNAFQVMGFSKGRRMVRGVLRGGQHVEFFRGQPGRSLDRLEKFRGGEVPGTGGRYQNAARTEPLD